MAYIISFQDSSAWWIAPQQPMTRKPWRGGFLLTRGLVKVLLLKLALEINSFAIDWTKLKPLDSFEIDIFLNKPDWMDMKSNHNGPVLTDPPPMTLTKSRLGIHSSLYSPPGVVFSHTLFLSIPRKKPLIVNDVRSSSWLDAMKSSSPTHRKKAKESSTELASTDTDFYHSWMVSFPSMFGKCLDVCLYEIFRPIICPPIMVLQLKYPSALTSFEQITNYGKGKRIALFLDYDGTLSPIVDNPDNAFMSDTVRIYSFNFVQLVKTH